MPGMNSSLLSATIQMEITSIEDYADDGTIAGQKNIDDADAERMFAFHSVAKIATPITIGLLLVIGVIGNLAVVYVTITSSRIIKHPVHSMLVLNLAVADLTYLVSSAPYEAITHTLPQWIFGSFLCRAFHYFNTQTMSVSIFTICSLATLRFMGIVRPFKFKSSYVTRSEKRAVVLIIVIVWGFASLLAAPKAFNYQTIYHKSPTNVTGVLCVWKEGTNKISYRITVILLTFLIPMLLVAFLYFLISREILCYMKSNNTILREEKSEYMRSTIMVFVLAVAFFICWFPFHLCTIIKLTKQYQDPKFFDVMLILNISGRSMSYAHACVNPIIYTFAAPGFRNSLSRSSSRTSRRSRRENPGMTINTVNFPTAQLNSNIGTQNESRPKTRCAI